MISVTIVPSAKPQVVAVAVALILMAALVSIIKSLVTKQPSASTILSWQGPAGKSVNVVSVEASGVSSQDQKY